MSMLQIVWKTIIPAIPTGFTIFMAYSTQYINVYFIGNLNDAHLLAGVGSGISITTIIVIATSIGIADSTAQWNFHDAR
eukprot:CAMPEP_0170455624 /NCGR_PEP_ID=MMETSP0123-20130129/3528_1 /TAXON_ID=182087 /ORGANISM="Favella ehrenbergii, Strain Fehren 1" /LENGTH=78 /DNA_ID=CAMNT_0010718827 /DNA_START=144 /DNA_END=380 /DNA_ORIENTATION=-